MASDKPLVIGYSGSLAFYEGEHKPDMRGGIRDWFWTYNHNITDPSTRSASFLFRAIRNLKQRINITGDDLKVELWGSISQHYRTQADELGIAEHVVISGYLPKTESNRKMSECDIMFLPMESPTAAGNPLFIPGKAYEYMHIGKLILALAMKCDCTDVLQPSGLLTRFDPTDEVGIAKWLGEVISDRNHLVVKANAQYIEQYSFRNITGQVAAVFDEILGKK
jgi:glycosyltransferase involved in cell wall biosynthesis